MLGHTGFFDVDDRLARLSWLGDQLEGFDRAVDFKMFRADLASAPGYGNCAQGGRPPCDPVMMFKILAIPAVNTVSDERAAFLNNDRVSLMRFRGLGLSGRVPDARTIWFFGEKLTRADVIQTLFDRFEATLPASAEIAVSGGISHASLIAAQKQRNPDEERKALKEGRVGLDHLADALTQEQQQGQTLPVVTETLSHRPLE
tara:strand:- start:53654 stop:54259 length:606 start_codon:yes stop_codon:yes gene_type:complete